MMNVIQPSEPRSLRQCIITPLMALQCTKQAVVYKQHKPASMFQILNISANVVDHNSLWSFDPWLGIAHRERSREADACKVTISNTAPIKLLPQRFQHRMVARKQHFHSATFDWLYVKDWSSQKSAPSTAIVCFLFGVSRFSTRATDVGPLQSEALTSVKIRVNPWLTQTQLHISRSSCR